MRRISAVRNECGRGPEADEPVPQLRLEAQSRIDIGPPQLDYFALTTRTRAIARIVDHDTDTTDRHREVLGDRPVTLPGLDRAGADYGEVALAKVRELRRIGPQHVQHRSAFILDGTQRGAQQALDAPCSCHQRAAQSMPRSRARSL